MALLFDFLQISHIVYENQNKKGVYNMAKYGIKITYSNGDEEDGLYGNFASKEEAFKEICVLAAKEACR